MKRLSRIIMVLITFSIISQCSVWASAMNEHMVSSLEAIELPWELNFTVSDSCSGHVFFMQAAANDVGYFAIMSLHQNLDDLSDVDFKKVYIDIYQPDGTFLQELSFTTTQAVTLALEENAVELYFYRSVLVYDLITQELHHYAVPEDVIVNGGIPKPSSGREFTAGEWKYTCKKGYLGYVQLSRTDGTQKQILIEMPGNRHIFWEVILPGSLGAGLILILFMNYQKKRAQSK